MQQELYCRNGTTKRFYRAIFKTRVIVKPLNDKQAQFFILSKDINRHNSNALCFVFKFFAEIVELLNPDIKNGA